MQDGEAHEEAAFSIAKKDKKMQSSAQSNKYGSSSQQKTAKQERGARMGVDSSKNEGRAGFKPPRTLPHGF